MRNWSTNTAKLKQNPQVFKLWKLEQLINFGLENEKLNEVDLRDNLSKLDIDPSKKKYLRFLLSQ